MDGDAMKKVLPGDKLRIPAIAYNAFIDAAQAAKKTQLFAGETELERRDRDIVLIKNQSGKYLRRFDAIGIDDALITPAENLDEFKNRYPLVGVEPDVNKHAGRWGVLLTPAAEGAICRCCVSGVVPARVYVNDADDQYCDICEGKEDGDFFCYLGTGASGARILWREKEGSGEGEIVWAIIRLCGGAGTIASVFQLLTDIGCDTYVALANPGVWNSSTLSYEDPLEGDLGEQTIVVVDPTHQLGAWVGDWAAAEKTTATLQIKNLGVRPVWRLVSRLTDQQSYCARLLDDPLSAGSYAPMKIFINIDWRENRKLLLYDGESEWYVDSTHPFYVYDHLLSEGEDVNKNSPIEATYRGDLKRWFATAAPCYYQGY